MRQAIQFEAVVENGIIKIPEEYVEEIHGVVKVSFHPVARKKIKSAPNGGPGQFSLDHFTALKIDTRGWKFDREEANER